MTTLDISTQTELSFSPSTNQQNGLYTNIDSSDFDMESNMSENRNISKITSSNSSSSRIPKKRRGFYKTIGSMDVGIIIDTDIFVIGATRSAKPTKLETVPKLGRGNANSCFLQQCVTFDGNRKRNGTISDIFQVIRAPPLLVSTQILGSSDATVTGTEKDSETDEQKSNDSQSSIRAVIKSSEKEYKIKVNGSEKRYKLKRQEDEKIVGQDMALSKAKRDTVERAVKQELKLEKDKAIEDFIRTVEDPDIKELVDYAAELLNPYMSKDVLHQRLLEEITIRQTREPKESEYHRQRPEQQRQQREQQQQQ
ncbi:hypothetical protein BGZ46_007826, partial [Entomortierella lignicola]